MLRLRQLITSNQVALEKWPVIVDHIVPKAAEKLRIKNLYKGHEYETAVLESLNLWQAHGSEIGDLIKVLKDHELNALAARILTEELVLDEAVCSDVRQSAPKAPAKVWFEVGDVVYNFTGREAELANLHEILTKSHSTKSVASNIVSICGLGGIGKSSLAREYAHRYRGDYDGNVIWINAETVGSMRASFVRLANRLVLVTNDQESSQDIAKRVCEKLADRKSLFIFDNVEEKSDFHQCVPRCENPDKETPYILVTTRRNDVVPVLKNQLSLVVLTMNEAATLILETIPYVKDDCAIQLAEKLQRLPLALQQALAYIRDKYMSDKECISKYLQEFKSSKQTLLDDEGFKDNATDYSLTTFSTWKITLARIADLHGGSSAIQVISVLACLNPDQISVRFLSHIFCEDSESQIQCSLKLLERFSIISVKDRKIGIHRLVQQVVRLSLGEATELDILDTIIRIIDKQLGKLEFTDFTQECLSHGLHIFPGQVRRTGIMKNTSEYLNGLCYFLEYYGNYSDALSIAEKSAAIYLSTVGEQHEDTIKMRWRAAEVYYKLENYSAALEVLEFIFPTSESVLGKEHRLTLKIHTSLAATCAEMGDPTKAIEMYDQIIPIRVEKYGESHAHVLNAKEAKADALFKLGKFDEAGILYQYVYQKREQLHRKNDLRTLMTLRSKGKVCDAKGDLRQALEVWGDVYEGLLQVVGETHPVAIKVKENIDDAEARLSRQRVCCLT